MNRNNPPNEPPPPGGIIITPDTLKCPKCGKDVFAILNLVKITQLISVSTGAHAQARPVGMGLLCFGCGHRIQKEDVEKGKEKPEEKSG